MFVPPQHRDPNGCPHCGAIHFASEICQRGNPATKERLYGEGALMIPAAFDGTVVVSDDPA